jgi:muconolactone delta-isomerase
MATIVFKAESKPDEIMPLVPAEQARIAEMVRAGQIEAMYMTPDWRRVWIVLKTGAIEEAQQAMSSLPLHRFMDVEIAPLGDFPVPGQEVAR